MGSEIDSYPEASLSVVVPTFHRPTQLRGTLGALRTASPDAQIIVVDDAPDHSARELVNQLARADTNLIYMAGAGRGAASARNAGARLADGDIIVFVDDDMIVPPDALDRFVAAVARFRPCFVNGTWVFEPSLERELRATPFGRFRADAEEWVKRGLPTRPLDHDFVEVALVTASDLAVERERFWSIGGFDERFPDAGYEDQELSIRARAAGIRLIQDRSIVCLHDDRRVARDQYLARLERGAATAVLVWMTHPSRFSGRTMIEQNAAVRASDPPSLVARKLAKTLLAGTVGQRVLAIVANSLEGLAPRSRQLQHLYRTMAAIAIRNGVRKGLRRYAGARS